MLADAARTWANLPGWLPSVRLEKLSLENAALPPNILGGPVPAQVVGQDGGQAAGISAQLVNHAAGGPRKKTADPTAALLVGQGSGQGRELGEVQGLPERPVDPTGKPALPGG